MDGWDRIVEEKIREAMEEGAFDNLEGKGRPLDLTENPFEDPSMRMAHRLLRNNGFTLPWIEESRDIVSSIETARESLALAVRMSSSDASLARAVEAFRARARELNRRITSFNVSAPASSVQLRTLDAELEIERALSWGKKA